MLVTVTKNVKVFKGNGDERKPAFDFFVNCGKAQVPVKLVFFPNDEGKDPAYIGRKCVLEAFESISVNLVKRKGTYVDSNTKEQRYYSNFTLRCGDDFIPVEVAYLPDEKTEKDPNYGVHKRVLSAFADTVGVKDYSAEVTDGGDTDETPEAPPSSARLIPAEDDGAPIPFR